MSAPYTPHTIAQIRKLAPLYTAQFIARELGWDLQQLERVARKHDVELRQPKREAADE